MQKERPRDNQNSKSGQSMFSQTTIQGDRTNISPAMQRYMAEEDRYHAFQVAGECNVNAYINAKVDKLGKWEQNWKDMNLGASGTK